MGVLDGIRILEWGAWHVVPGAGALLGELGADVIKIEEPGKGDPSRGYGQIKGVPIILAGNRRVTAEIENTSKRSIALDLKSREGREVAYRLVKKTDVFMHNYQETTAQKLGLDYESLSAVNPRLLYLYSTAFGSKGPEKDLLAMDPVGQARAGVMDLARAGRNFPPSPVGEGPGDEMTAHVAVMAVLGGLLARERFGIAQKIEISMLGSIMSLLRVNLGCAALLGTSVPRMDRTEFPNPLWNWYQCRDGRWIMFCHLQSDVFWSEFARTIGIASLENDPKFDSAASRAKNSRELIAIIDKLFAEKTYDEWWKILLEKRGKLIFSPVNTPLDVVSDPQVVANEYFTNFKHPVLGDIKLQAFPVHFSKTPARITREAPEVGQHTEEILLENGFSWGEISGLKERRVI